MPKYLRTRVSPRERRGVGGWLKKNKYPSRKSRCHVPQEGGGSRAKGRGAPARRGSRARLRSLRGAAPGGPTRPQERARAGATGEGRPGLSPRQPRGAPHRVRVPSLFPSPSPQGSALPGGGRQEPEPGGRRGPGPGIGRGSERRGWCVAVLLPRTGSVSRGRPKLSGAGGARMGGARGPPCCAPPGSRSPGTGPPGRGQPRTELRGGGGGPAGAEGTAPGASTPLRLERAVAGLGASRGLPAPRSGPGREAPAAFVPPAATGWAGLSARRGSPKEILFSSSLLPFLSLLSSFPFPPFLPSPFPFPPFLLSFPSLPAFFPPSLPCPLYFPPSLHPSLTSSFPFPDLPHLHNFVIRTECAVHDLTSLKLLRGENPDISFTTALLGCSFTLSE